MEGRNNQYHPWFHACTGGLGMYPALTGKDKGRLLCVRSLLTWAAQK